MAIQDEMYKLIEQEINQTIEAGKEVRTVNYDKAKEVARRLTSLSTDTSDADTLINQYIANIKNICNS
jgi:ribosomal protein L1